MDTKVLEAEVVHCLHRGPVNIKKGVIPSLFFPRVYYHLLSFAVIQEEIIVLAPAGQFLCTTLRYAFSLFLVNRPTTAVFSANLMRVLVSDLSVQGLKTQPWCANVMDECG